MNLHEINFDFKEQHTENILECSAIDLVYMLLFMRNVDELEEYIDNPIRTYSSGMYMRLAFSVAINVDADILLIDEILAVGDQAFQEKCINKLNELRKTGVTVVLVSHAMGQVNAIADRCIWIDQGKIVEDGRDRKSVV